MNFCDLLVRAKSGEKEAMEELLSMYNPMLMKHAIINGVFDEDLHRGDLLRLFAFRATQGNVSAGLNHSSKIHTLFRTTVPGRTGNSGRHRL